MQLVPDVFVLDSEGRWDTDWLTGHNPAAGVAHKAARREASVVGPPLPRVDCQDRRDADQ